MRLSIITINRNNLLGLRQTVESVLKQSFTDFEYLVIDGASTDGSAEYIQEKAQHFTYWVSEPDTGIYAAMNKGIRAATGDYLLFLNSGDYLVADSVLEKCVQHGVFSSDTTIVYGNLRITDRGKFKVCTYPSKLSFYFFYTWTLPHQATFMHSRCFTQYGLYDENYRLISDWIKWLEILHGKEPYQHLNMLISHFDTPGASSDEEAILSEQTKYLQENYPLYLPDYQRLHAITEQRKIGKTIRKCIVKIYRSLR